MYEPKLEFPKGWEVQTKKPSVGEYGYFSGTTQSKDVFSWSPLE